MEELGELIGALIATVIIILLIGAAVFVVRLAWELAGNLL